MQFYSNMRALLEENGENFSLEVFQRPDIQELGTRALDSCNKWHQRKCVLQAPLVLWIVIALSLFRYCSIVEVFKIILRAVRGNTLGTSLKATTPEAVYHARTRLTAEPLRFFARALAELVEPAATFFGLISVGIDGVSMDVPDTVPNRDEFGLPGSSRGETAFPQLKAVPLLYTDTHQVIDCEWGRCHFSELEGAEKLIDSGVLDSRHCLFLDRRYTKVQLWFKLLGRRIHFVHRLSGTYDAVPHTKLGPGDWLMDIWLETEIPIEERTGKETKRLECRTVRLIEYVIEHRGKKEVVQLITDLLCPRQYPARCIAVGYHRRWECELANDELKVHQSTVLHGSLHTTFRSKKPLGVIQEFWGLMCAYNLIRGLMMEAGQKHDVPPLEISFVETLNIIRDALPRLQSSQAHERGALYARMIDDIATSLIDRPRRKRWNVRAVKRKMSKFPVKKRNQHSVTRDFAAELILVEAYVGD